MARIIHPSALAELGVTALIMSIFVGINWSKV
jgi:hypothetical protein